MDGMQVAGAPGGAGTGTGLTSPSSPGALYCVLRNVCGLWELSLTNEDCSPHAGPAVRLLSPERASDSTGGHARKWSGSTEDPMNCR